MYYSVHGSIVCYHFGLARCFKSPDICETNTYITYKHTWPEFIFYRLLDFSFAPSARCLRLNKSFIVTFRAKWRQKTPDFKKRCNIVRSVWRHQKGMLTKLCSDMDWVFIWRHARFEVHSLSGAGDNAENLKGGGASAAPQYRTCTLHRSQPENTMASAQPWWQANHQIWTLCHQRLGQKPWKNKCRCKHSARVLHAQCAP